MCGAAKVRPVKPPRTHLVWSAFTFMLFFLPFGLIAGLYGFRTMRLVQADDLEAATASSLLARRWNIAGMAVGVVLWTVIVAGLLLLGATSPFA
jgi:predicted metal-binding membrane protein